MVCDAPLPRPVRQIAPSEFFHRYLPSLFAALTTHLRATWPDLEDFAEVALDGTDLFSMSLTNGQLFCATRSSAAPFFRLSCSQEAWRIGVNTILPMLLDNAKHRRQPLDAEHQRAAARFGAKDLAESKALAGTVHLHYTDDAGDVATYTVVLHEGSGPEVTVQAQENDLAAVLQGFSSAPRLLRSRLQIAGDAAYLMRLINFINSWAQ